MPRTLARFAVHPPFKLHHSIYSKSYCSQCIRIKCILYIASVLFIAVVILIFIGTIEVSEVNKQMFAEKKQMLYASTNIATPTENELKTFSNDMLRDSLDFLLRPQKNIKKAINDKIILNKSTSADISSTDYWDFPIANLLKLTSNKLENIAQMNASEFSFFVSNIAHAQYDQRSKSREYGEFQIHLARKKWFETTIIGKDKKIDSVSNTILDFNTRCTQYRNRDLYKKSIKMLKWEPEWKEICNWTNTALFWHSMHGTMIGRDFRVSNMKYGIIHHQHFMWHLTKDYKTANDDQCGCPSNVAFVFAQNDNHSIKSEERLIEHSYNMCNSKNCHFFQYAHEYFPWDWFGKIGPLQTMINENILVFDKFDYILLTDADDQTLVGSPIADPDIIQRFLFYNCTILLAGEATSYPHWQRKEASFENSVSPWARHHQHMNAGGMMAKNNGKFRMYLQEMRENYELFTVEQAKEIREKGKNYWRDQTVWREMHRKYYPDIKIDSLSKIWTRVDIYMYDL